jgi:5-methylcytosine-specific restriction endonuclease McrA
MLMRRALLLNADFTPLRFISDCAAITLYYKGRAEVIDGLDGKPSQWDEEFRSPSTSIHIPATMRLYKRVHKKWRPPRFRKKVLFNRDDWRCQYCNVKLNNDSITIDHVMPSSRGGLTSWLNCVSSCKSCNKRKADKTPEEAGMKILKRPATPTSLHYWDVYRSNVWHADWDCYIPKADDRVV